MEDLATPSGEKSDCKPRFLSTFKNLYIHEVFYRGGASVLRSSKWIAHPWQEPRPAEPRGRSITVAHCLSMGHCLEPVRCHGVVNEKQFSICEVNSHLDCGWGLLQAAGNSKYPTAEWVFQLYKWHRYAEPPFSTHCLNINSHILIGHFIHSSVWGANHPAAIF